MLMLRAKYQSALKTENIKHGILLMFLRHLYAKIWAKIDFPNLEAAILDFADLIWIKEKNDNIFLFHL